MKINYVEFKGYMVYWDSDAFCKVDGDEIVEEVPFDSPTGQQLMHELLATGRTITTDPLGLWVCRCGNTPLADGFDACDASGQVVEATFANYAEKLFLCQRCGRIFHPLTLEIVGQRT